MEKTGDINDRTPQEHDDEPLAKNAEERHKQLENHVTTRAADHAKRELGKQSQK